MNHKVLAYQEVLLSFATITRYDDEMGLEYSPRDGSVSCCPAEPSVVLIEKSTCIILEDEIPCTQI